MKYKKETSTKMYAPFYCICCVALAAIRLLPRTSVSAAYYGYAAEGKTSFVFDVRACRNAFISLWNKDVEIYEAGLGRGDSANPWSTLKRIGEQQKVYWSHTLDCNASMPFYIIWENATVKVGKGYNVGTDVIMEIHDINMPPIDEVKLESSSTEVYFDIERGN